MRGRGGIPQRRGSRGVPEEAGGDDMGLALDSVMVAGEESCALAECWKVLPLQLCGLRVGVGAHCWWRVLEKVGKVRSEVGGAAWGREGRPVIRV